VARYANWVNTIFLAALDEGLIVKNPANSKHAGRPRGESTKRVKPFSIWNVGQLTRFCDWAITEDESSQIRCQPNRGQTQVDAGGIRGVEGLRLLDGALWMAASRQARP
jgi:hypothetical protein